MVGASELKPQFFSAENDEGVKLRNQCAEMALKDLTGYLQTNDGEVAIYDGTNTTKQRRSRVNEQLQTMLKGYQYSLIWLEIVCDDEELINANIIRAKINNPDFVDKQQDVAVQEFRDRIQNYVKVYEQVEEKEYEGIRIIKYFNLGKQIQMTNMEQNQVQKKVIGFILNMNLKLTPIYLVQTSSSIDNSNTNNTNNSNSNSNIVENNNNKKEEEEMQQLVYEELIKDYFQKEIIQDEQFTNLFEVYSQLHNLQEINVIIKDRLLQNLKNRFKPQKEPRKKSTDSDYESKQQQQFLKLVDVFSFQQDGRLNALFRQMGFNIRNVKNEHLVEKYQNIRTENDYNYRFQQINYLEPLIYEIERQNFPIIIVGEQYELQKICDYLTQDEQSISYFNNQMGFNRIQKDIVYKLTPDTYYCQIQKIRVDREIKKWFNWTSAIICSDEGHDYM